MHPTTHEETMNAPTDLNALKTLRGDDLEVVRMGPVTTD